MTEQDTKSLADKIREAEARLKQLEADLYFTQGYIKALVEMAEKEASNAKEDS